MTRSELEAAVRAELDRQRIAPQESAFQHWLDSVYQGISKRYDAKNLADQFRVNYVKSVGVHRRGRLPVAAEDA